jgi:NitT/TauT family transport system ATP-binding protein
MTPTASPVRLERVAKQFSTGVLALQEASLDVQPGEFVSILGPSGCGKSTILRLLAGLDTASSGSVVAPALQGQRADTAFVFQDATLMPWATVFDNVWLPLRLAGKSRREAAPLIDPVLEQVDLMEFREAYPAELSGGMKMRTSIARALVATPQLLLMDEPFAALDEVTRSRLGADLLRWWAARKLSIIFVTHSIFEAAYLSQRVLVMSARPGRIISEVRVEQPTPRDAEFRLTARYQAVCRELSAALEQAR